MAKAIKVNDSYFVTRKIGFIGKLQGYIKVKKTLNAT